MLVCLTIAVLGPVVFPSREYLPNPWCIVWCTRDPPNSAVRVLDCSNLPSLFAIWHRYPVWHSYEQPHPFLNATRFWELIPLFYQVRLSAEICLYKLAWRIL